MFEMLRLAYRCGGDKTKANNNNNNNNNNNERISRAPFQVKHAELRRTGAKTKIQNTCIYKTPKTAGVQTIMLKHPTVAGDPIMLMIFMIFWGLKIMGACGWLFHGYAVWG